MRSAFESYLQPIQSWWIYYFGVSEPSVLITPFAQILAILNRARDFLSNYTSNSPSYSPHDPNMCSTKSIGCDEKYVNCLHRFDVHYVNQLLNEFDWCLEVLDSLQSKRSVSSLTRMKFIINNQSNLAPDLFKLDQISNHHPLSTFGFYLFMKTNVLQKLSIPSVTMLNCLRQIESRYNSTAPFHNSIHALDVLHATYQLFQCNSLKNIFSDLETFAIFFASAIHDIDHPGLTNQYLINTNHELALLYNDISVLENHHLHVAFKLINTQIECDFTKYFTNQQKLLFRKMVIALVLSTDMSKHMSLLADLKTSVEKQKAFQGNVINLDSYSARMQILECIIHAADLSNPTKPLKIYQEWVSRIMEEMFRQGDQEKQYGIEISPMCDRETACIYSTQIGFIDYIVYPLWETMAELLHPGLQVLMDNITNNRNWYVKAKEEEEEEVKEENKKNNSIDQ
ncbi:camp-specific 3,5-cyclic phosphodiesterase,putative [Schistosoma mansoni]|uniref:camp-specific 3,5-cyclic phosphodiesterase,putative n=1 Tax=Schistosoma mansoni TaxID=6183 RepID=UPI00022C8667|nr:camp-specific 3,5-cyclic phosphodiesterase,putative [Schistosoma mansoni]|eukprot:XP_018647025.1 camp-specific 3,5-cyclic phosphodiesterase,putative [Schistosoma mansoni]